MEDNQNEQLQVRMPNCTATQTSLIISENISQEEWLKIRDALNRVDNARLWWWGDYLNYGERRFGEIYKEALQESGYSYQVLRNAKRVSKAVDSSIRRASLAWSSHAALAVLPRDQQIVLLDLAEQQKLTRNQLEQRVKGLLSGSSDSQESIQPLSGDSDADPYLASNSVRGAEFEIYVLKLLKKLYPHHTWYHQGRHKINERGLDFIAKQTSKMETFPQIIGVQVKFHADKQTPSDLEWLKFLAGCFVRRIDLAYFITTGCLTGEQRREAGEANVTVIAGRDELCRIVTLHGIEQFHFLDEEEP